MGIIPNETLWTVNKTALVGGKDVYGGADYGGSLERLTGYRGCRFVSLSVYYEDEDTAEHNSVNLRKAEATDLRDALTAAIETMED